MSTQQKEKLETLKAMKAKIENAKDPRVVCDEILKSLASQKDPLVKSDETENEWRGGGAGECCSLA
eukprot:CAMPEP_0197542788 /NCGR_PEP_ID=MMETSP1318-20131121/67892_1 /TAXON_ID=552666 /ORGANISM="Partenskyella glossopodia, Strain RCC365" /LENGTH=65 /DNA_ID=CAMNT_0043102077 /DNA_START=590 /DNA_END=787 /DNA_ORIENTATION=-